MADTVHLVHRARREPRPTQSPREGVERTACGRWTAAVTVTDPVEVTCQTCRGSKDFKLFPAPDASECPDCDGPPEANYLGFARLVTGATTGTFTRCPNYFHTKEPTDAH